MFWIGLILPVCYVAGVTGALIPTQWPLLSIVLVVVLWRPGRVTWLHIGGLAFLGYAGVSLAWAPQPINSTFGLWQVWIWAMAFWYGATSESLSPLWRGMAVGLSISSAVAIGQALGLPFLPEFYMRPAGTLFNPALAAALTALVVVALSCGNDWRYVPALLPGLWLAHSRGGWLVIGVGLAARLHWGFAVALLFAAANIALFMASPSDFERLQTWRAAANGLSLSGFGTGSFLNLIYWTDGRLVHPEYVHNDYLQLAFEYGLGAVPVYLIIAAALSRTTHPCWPVFAAFAALAAFFFPLYCAPLAFVGAVLAGHLLRGIDRAWPAGGERRPAIVPWSALT